MVEDIQSQDGPFKCRQITLPGSNSIPVIHLQVLFLYPSTSLMLWFSVGESGSIGTTSMALPMPKHMPTASTRVDGYSAADTTDRLANLLCRKYNRQVFVSAHLPRAQMQLIQSEDGSGEEVIVKRVLTELHRIIKEEKDTDYSIAQNTIADSNTVIKSQSAITGQEKHISEKIDESAVNNGLEELTLEI